MRRRLFVLSVLIAATVSCGHAVPSQRSMRTTGMATTLWLQDLRETTEGAADRAEALGTVQGAAAIHGIHFYPTTGGTAVPAMVATANTSQAGSWDGKTYWFYSRRLSAGVTIAGNITAHHQGRDFASMNPVHATFRWEVYKQTTSANVETMIGAATEPDVASGEVTATYFSQTITVPSSITLAVGERLVVKVYLVPSSGQTMAASANSIVMPFNGGSGNPEADVTFTETMTFATNVTELYFRNSAVNAISGYKDLLLTANGSTFVTDVTTITANAAEIQAAVSAGGAALAWISPRFSGSFLFTEPDSAALPITASSGLNASESATTVNAVVWLRLYRWRKGVETLCAEIKRTGELPTTLSVVTLTPTNTTWTTTPTPFLPDDRLVAKIFFAPVPSQSLAAGTASFKFDGGASINETNASRIWLYDLPLTGFKAETDPATPATIPDGLNTLGLGN